MLTVCRRRWASPAARHAPDQTVLCAFCMWRVSQLTGLCVSLCGYSIISKQFLGKVLLVVVDTETNWDTGNTGVMPYSLYISKSHEQTKDE